MTLHLASLDSKLPYSPPTIARFLHRLEVYNLKTHHTYTIQCFVIFQPFEMSYLMRCISPPLLLCPQKKPFIFLWTYLNPVLPQVTKLRTCPNMMRPVEWGVKHYLLCVTQVLSSFLFFSIGNWNLFLYVVT